MTGKVRRKKVSLRERGQNLRQFREHAGLTLQDVASQADLSEAMVSLYETGKRELSPAAHKRLLDAVESALAKKEEATKKSKGGLARLSDLLGHPRNFSEDEKSVKRLFGSRENLLEILDLGKELARKDRLIESCDRLINKQAEQILILKEIVSAHQDLSSEQDATIRDLERRIAELREEVATAHEKVPVG